jgi:hypothetical protein
MTERGVGLAIFLTIENGTVLVAEHSASQARKPGLLEKLTLTN